MNQQVPVETAIGPEASFLDRLASHLQGAADSRAVFGAPVDREGVTVIPVAKSRWGMGGGMRRWHQERGGEPAADRGGGGGAKVTPVGFIELGSGTARFRRIPDPADGVRFLVAGGMLGLSLVRTVAFFRATRRGRRLRIRFGRRFRGARGPLRLLSRRR